MSIEILRGVVLPLHRVCWSFDYFDWVNTRLCNTRINSWLVDNMGPMGDLYEVDRLGSNYIVRPWLDAENGYSDNDIHLISDGFDECWEILHSNATALMPEADAIFYVEQSCGAGWVRMSIGNHTIKDDHYEQGYHMWVAFEDELMALQCKLAVS